MRKLTYNQAQAFRDGLVNFLERFAAERTAGRDDHWTRPIASALGSLADHVRTLPLEDPRFFQLAETHWSMPGSGRREPFTPTPSQDSILFNLGGMGGGVKLGPEETVSLLVSAGLEDLTAICKKNEQRLEHELERAEKRIAEAEAKVEPLERAEVERDDERARAERLEGRLDVLQRQTADLEGFLAAGKDGKQARRVHVGGGAENAGIYKTLVDGEFVLEMGWNDSEGKQRWRRLPPHRDIDWARRKRAQLSGAPYVPEPDDTTDPDPGETADTTTTDTTIQTGKD